MSMPINSKPQRQFPPLNVTDVRLAFECPRLFYLKQRFGGDYLFLPKGYILEIDNAFVYLANQLMNMIRQESIIQVLFAGQFEELVVEAIANQIQQLFYELIFFPYLQTIITKNITLATGLYQVWQVLTKLIFNMSEIIVKNRRYCHESVVVRRTLITGEIPVDYTFKIAGGKSQKLTGKVNNLIFDFETRRLCVVDFQTYETVEVSSQLIGVALYSFLLKQKKKVSIDAIVYRVLPELGEYHYSWEKLENVVEGSVPGKLEEMRKWLRWEEFQHDPPPRTEHEYLCDICPQKERCQSFFDGSG
ncbi:MAG: PD-(D/E)XK nuclease family protein [Microcoleaceae cyanobacterium MO_207.B10]|nr:PD-(D/E)XK nuclease family protein [Microcoleaceae cyanobacterium MO_207.B10]